jgi:hypothetical protein
MVDCLILLWVALTRLFCSRVRLEAEILVLRQQLNVVRRKSGQRFAFGDFDRLVFVGLYRLVPGIVEALAVVRPETVSVAPGSAPSRPLRAASGGGLRPALTAPARGAPPTAGRDKGMVPGGRTKGCPLPP